MHIKFPLKFFQKQKPPQGLCCLYLLPDKFIIAHIVQDTPSAPTLKFIEVCSWQQCNLRLILEELVEKYNLDAAVCSLVLHPSYYQLMLLDPPAVKPEEVSLALRWQIKDLVTFPTQDIALDYFAIPSHISLQEKIYVVATQRSQLQTIADIIYNCGLNLKYIDIAELALRNINSLYQDEACILGLLIFSNDNAELIITHKGNLLLARQLTIPEEINFNELQTNDLPYWIHNITLEIERSFTYCQSQQQVELPNKLLVAVSSPALMAILTKQLNIDTAEVVIETKIHVEYLPGELSYSSKDYLIAIGGALRGNSYAGN